MDMVFALPHFRGPIKETVDWGTLASPTQTGAQ